MPYTWQLSFKYNVRVETEVIKYVDSRRNYYYLVYNIHMNISMALFIIVICQLRQTVYSQQQQSSVTNQKQHEPLPKQTTKTRT